MTKEELLESFVARLDRILNGQVDYTCGDPEQPQMLAAACGYSVVVDWDQIGWIYHSRLRLLQMAMADLQNQLKEYKITDAPASSRALRKVNISGRQRISGGDQGTSRKRASSSQ
jgi:predicted component of type VI protein secretion system